MEYIKAIRQLIGSRPFIFPGATIVVINNEGQVLLQHRKDTNNWGLPGGGMELAESFEETATRELYEETGLHANKLYFIDILSGKEWYFKYPNGDEVYNVIALYKCTDVSGEPGAKDNESYNVKYYSIDKLPALEGRAGLILDKYKQQLF